MAAAATTVPGSGSTSGPLLQSLEDGVLTLTLNRPAALNAFDRAMKEALLRALKAAERDRDVRAVIVTGAGRAFCAGQDLKERSGPGRDPLSAELRLRYNPIILAMRRLEKPIVAAVNGVAAGAGCSLALACDLIVASESASFVQAFGRVGLVPDTGSTWFLPRLVGCARAAEMMLLGEPIDALTAERWGLVNRVARPDALLDETRALAARLAGAAPIAIRLTKRAMGRALESSLEDALEFEAGAQSVAGRSRDHQEGVSAFAEKRAAHFTGE